MTQVISLGRILGKALGVASVTPFSDDVFSGCHDGAAGVQWHIAADRVTGATWLAVNLEGLKYGRERPIAKLLQRELARPAVLGVLHLLPRAHEVAVHLTRDAWSGRQRIAIEERTIARRAASELTREIWKRMMAEGLECLGPAGARGRQLLRRSGAPAPEMLDVVPHFTAGIRVWTALPPSAAEAVALVAAAKAQLEPVHEVVMDRLSY